MRYRRVLLAVWPEPLMVAIVIEKSFTTGICLLSGGTAACLDKTLMVMPLPHIH